MHIINYGVFKKTIFRQISIFHPPHPPVGKIRYLSAGYPPEIYPSARKRALPPGQQWALLWQSESGRLFNICLAGHYRAENPEQLGFTETITGGKRNKSSLRQLHN